MKKGDKYHIYMPTGDRRPYLIHIFKIFKTPEGYSQVIYKFFGRHKQWWHYELIEMTTLERKIIWAAEIKEKEKSKNGTL